VKFTFGQLALAVQLVAPGVTPSTLHLPTAGQSAAVPHVFAIRLQLPPTAGQVVVQTFPVVLQVPVLGQFAADVQAVPVCTLQWPLTAAQLASKLQMAPPGAPPHRFMPAHCVAWFVIWQGWPLFVQVPVVAGQSAPEKHVLLLLMLHLPVAAQSALDVQDVPTLMLHWPGMVVQTVGAFAVVHGTPLLEQVPAVVQICGQTVFSVHEISGLAGLQPGGS
jgi:hypothetical protein